MFEMEIFMSSANVTASREKFGGQMSEGEMLFCRQLRERLRTVIEGRDDFHLAMVNLLLDLQEIRKNRSDVDVALESGWQPNIARPVPQMRALASDSERAVLEDMDGLIDYAMRNGLGFQSVFSTLWHDVGMLRFYKWSLEDAQKDETFHLRVAGWAKRNVAIVGEPDAEKE